MFGLDDLIEGGIGAIGGAIGGVIEGSAKSQAQQEFEQAVQKLQAVGIPSAEARQIVLQHYQSQGQLTPELEQAITAPDSKAAETATDPAYKQAEMDALSELQNISDKGGLTTTDRANLDDLLGQAETKARGAREANLATIRSRGQLGSGLELAAMNDADQAAANQEHADALRVAGNAEDRALQSIMQSGQLGGQLENQQFNEGFKKGTAADEIAKFNAQTRQRVQTANVDRQNQAQETNLKNNQNLANKNVDLTNQQTTYNSQMPREAALDQLQQAKDVAGVLEKQADNTRQFADDTAKGVGNAASGIVKLFGSKKRDDGEE